MRSLKAKQRKEFLSVAERLAKRSSGSAREMLQERSAEYGSVDVGKYLGEVRFVIVGGVATRLYMPERMTLDTDVLILAGDLPQAENALEQAGCQRVGPLAIGGSSWRLPFGRNLDLIALVEPWVEEAIDAAVRAPDGQPYASLPYLVLTKLASGRLQDLTDISRMLGAAQQDMLNDVRELVARYRPQEVEDLQSLISLGKLEYDSEDAR